MTSSQEFFIDMFRDYLKGKVSDSVSYEYIRIVRKFMESARNISQTDEDAMKGVATEFLNIENPNSYRNTLAALKKLFEFIGQPQTLGNFKYKATMPSFSIATPSLEEMQIFGKAIENDRIRVYYYLGVVSAIRPEHLLRLTVKLFDKRNNMINTWMKTYGKKNFFFSFYTPEIKPIIEKYIEALPDNEKLFLLGMRYIQKEFRDASKKSGIKIVPKMMRKFATNWFRRHGMIPEDVDVITSHMPQSIVARHYMDVSRIREEYDKATKDLKLIV